MARSAGKERTRKIGAVDFIIIFAVLAIILTGVLRYTLDEGLFTKNDTECNVSFSITSVRYTTYDMLEASEKIYLSDSEFLGTLVSATVTPAIFYATDSEGNVKEAYYPENTLVDINGVMLCKLSDNEGRYLAANGTHICPGTTLTLRTDTADLTVVITSVSAVNAPES